VAVILGEDESKSGEASIKDLGSGEQRRVRQAALEEALEQTLRGPVASGTGEQRPRG
jgi:histidyl-tRNA synthetase